MEEIDYVPGKVYDYKVFLDEKGGDVLYGTQYAGHRKFKVAFDSDGGSTVASQFIRNGATASTPEEPEKAGYNFVGWKNGGDDFSFSTTISGNVTLTAQWKERPTLVLADEHSYMIDRYNDVGYTVDLNDYTAGELVLKNGETTLTADTDYYFDEGSSKLVMKASYLNDIYRFGTSSYTLNLNGTDFAVVYENAANRVLNGGFDRGTLYGWNSYAIWKNESGMIAWTDDRVVNGTYFDDKYSYNRDGGYNLGIYGGGISKDSGQERMGHLRSSNFTLGGTGWISFKLGGGNVPQFAYVSVRKTADNVEVARFGNRHFNDTSKVPVNNSNDGTKKNAEAYLFQYYYNLSAYLGQQLYFVISDTSSNNWCVLSADSFYTYYANAPVTSEDTLATNILPTLKNSNNEPTNEILGSHQFSSDGVSNYWTIDGSGWGYVSEKNNGMRSDAVGGDPAVGILRSAAFTLNGNKYVKFGWGGGLKYDKVIFVSIKEVGTNIEVKRYVRREDKSDFKADSYENCIFDLSDLSTDKAYYIEFCDNRTDGWGVSYVRSLYLIDKSTYDGITSGDRAVEISGIVTDYTYVNPY